MAEQNYTNHRRYVPGFHFVLLALIFIAFFGSVFFLIRSYVHGIDRVGSVVVFLSVVNIMFLYFYARQFPVVAQNRAIRAEENLRHFVLTGKMLDPRLKMSQIVALRFASDIEFPGLAIRAVSEDMSNDDIKKEIKTWKADNVRV